MLALLLLLKLSSSAYPPEQIHLSYSNDSKSMVFNWITFDYPIVTSSIVKIGKEAEPSSLNLTFKGSEYLFTDCGSEKTNRTIHVVTADNLEEYTSYYYQLGDDFYGLSDVLSFTSMITPKIQKSEDIPQKFIIYGDLGDVNAQTLTAIENEVLNNNVDMVFHVGDLAYDFYNENGTKGDEFMRDIEPISSHVPYMVAPGNHESTYNFSHYTQRFRGIENSDGSIVWTQSGPVPNNWYYSWDVGIVHFIAIDTEIYFDFPWMIESQYSWLENDLILANKNSNNVSWIIVGGHKPLYCSSSGSDCTTNAEKLRNGVKNSNGTYSYGLEELFYKYNVDFYFAGHEHNYERMFDIYQNISDCRVYNMTSTTYILSGSPGCDEYHSGFTSSQPYWSAFRTQAYSYTRVYVYNESSVLLEQVVQDNTLPPDEQGVIDSVWYTQFMHDFSGNMSGGRRNGEFGECGGVSKYALNMHVSGVFEEENSVEYRGNDKELYKNVPGVFW